MSGTMMLSHLATLVAVTVAADAERTFRLEFEPGRVITYRMTSEKQVTRDDQPDASSIRFVVSRRAQTVSGDRADLLYRFEQIAMMRRAGDRVEQFDSRDAKAATADNPLSAIVGQQFLVTLDRRGHVVDLAARGADGPARSIAEAQLRTMLRTLYSWLPERPVVPGKPWHRQESTDAGLVEITRQNTLSVVSDDPHRVDIVSQIVLTGKPTPRDVELNESAGSFAAKFFGRKSPPTRLEGRLKAEPGEGHIAFDPQMGMVQSVSASIGFTMTAYRLNGDEEPTPVSEETVAAKTRIERLVNSRAAN